MVGKANNMLAKLAALTCGFFIGHSARTLLFSEPIPIRKDEEVQKSKRTRKIFMAEDNFDIMHPKPCGHGMRLLNCALTAYAKPDFLQKLNKRSGHGHGLEQPGYQMDFSVNESQCTSSRDLNSIAIDKEALLEAFDEDMLYTNNNPTENLNSEMPVKTEKFQILAPNALDENSFNMVVQMHDIPQE